MLNQTDQRVYKAYMSWSCNMPCYARPEDIKPLLPYSLCRIRVSTRKLVVEGLLNEVDGGQCEPTT